MQATTILFLAGFLGGIINAIAGGGAILIFPAFLLAGLAPVNATATISLAVLPGTVSSAFGYKDRLATVPKHFLWLMVPSAIGAAVGAQFLIGINTETFESIVPWLVLSAVILLGLQAKIHRAIISQKQLVKTSSRLGIPILFTSVFILSVYGGFFATGFGLMLLAILGLSRLKNSYQMSAVKNLCGVALTLVSAAFFISSGLLDLRLGLIAAGGTLIGGYIGAKLSQKVSSHTVHNISLLIGISITVYLFLTI